MNAVLSLQPERRQPTTRPPRGHMGFSWGRFPFRGGVEYRLFRRDLTGRLHMEARRFFDGEAPAHMAVSLRRARNHLRDRVDRIVLEQLGLPCA